MIIYFLPQNAWLLFTKPKKWKKSWCALKLDISKAYDRLSWSFMEVILIHMKFPPQWIQIIKKCFSTIKYTILLNGHISGSFIPQRGVWQGDPLSSYIFLLCSNVLSCMLQKLEDEGKIKGIQFAHRGPRINHLMYADDTILFFEATPQACTAIKHVLDVYGKMASQEVS